MILRKEPLYYKVIMNTITDSNANAKGNLEAECQSNLDSRDYCAGIKSLRSDD
jgi:hypothetical protein